MFRLRIRLFLRSPLAWLWRFVFSPIVCVWKTIPSYLPFYLVCIIAGYALWNGRQQTTVISPFHLPPESKEESLPFSGETVANVLRDAMVSVQKEAEGQTAPPPCESMVQSTESFGGLTSAPVLTHVETPNPVAVEVRGISLSALISFAREVLHRERNISGDVNS